MTMVLDDAARSFLESQHAAAMTTLRADDMPHSVRVAVALVDGKIWSSGTPKRLRTKHLHRDARSTLFVFDNAWRWLSMECRVRILEGTEVPQQSLRMFQQMQQGMPISTGHVLWYGSEITIDGFLQAMIDERRLIYEFEVERFYGLYGEMPPG